MANALNIWDEKAKQYVGLPVLKGDKGDRGYSGLVPTIEVPWSSEVVIPANCDVEPIVLQNDTIFSLGETVEGYSNLWLFAISQGNTAYNVTLPEAKWTLGVAPTFRINTTTQILLYYVGEELRGIWQ